MIEVLVHSFDLEKMRVLSLFFQLKKEQIIIYDGDIHKQKLCSCQQERSLHMGWKWALFILLLISY